MDRNGPAWDQTPSPPSSGAARWVYLALGFTFVGIGGLGILLPGLPTTPFMILAAWAFSRSSRRFHDWLYHHPLFGPSIQRWRAHRVIPLPAKLMSLTAMMGSFVLLAWRGSSLPGLIVVAVGMSWGTWFIWRCPSKVPGG